MGLIQIVLDNEETSQERSLLRDMLSPDKMGSYINGTNLSAKTPEVARITTHIPPPLKNW